MIISELVSNRILTEPACQKVSWQPSATDLHLVFPLPFFSQESQLVIFQHRKPYWNFLQEKNLLALQNLSHIQVLFLKS